ncbi:MAG TPA: sulfotransferase domain-containing protein [Tepidisphaeraceae bacterium]|nr:sulfotransferase domain-containing protein [Tepidisphaeraceae bacterium]
MPEQRVVHITSERCGSQWVKNVLTQREILGPSGLCFSGVTGSIFSQRELDIAPNTFSGPIYNMNQWEWRHWRKPGDRAIVVIRDPRDVVISLMFAWLCSHQIDPYIQVVRRVFVGLPDDGERLTYVMGANGPYQRMIHSWCADRDATSLLIRYEDLVADALSGFGRILDWLDWNVSHQALESAIGEFSFQSKDGREMGQEDVFSHQRRGLPGDWRNYFTRDHGSLWEQLYPGLLTAAKYEQRDDWWHSLPEAIQRPPRFPSNPQFVETEVLRNRNVRLEREIEDKETMIRELTTTCSERLKTIGDKERIISELVRVCDQRLTVIRALHSSWGTRLANGACRLKNFLLFRWRADARSGATAYLAENDDAIGKT